MSSKDRPRCGSPSDVPNPGGMPTEGRLEGRRGSLSMAMDKCHCLLLKVVLISCVTPNLPWGKGKTHKETLCSLGVSIYDLVWCL